MGETEPAPDETEQEDARRRHFWWNVAWMEAMELFWGFSLPLVASGTILAVFLKRLGAGPLLIGALPALQMMAFGMVQLPAARWSRRLRVKTPVSAITYGAAMLVWAVAGLLALVLAEARPGAMIAALLAFAALHSLALGIGAPNWADVFARLFPPDRRGFASGANWTVYGASGIMGALLARHTLDTVPYPQNFAYLMLIAGVAGGLGMQFLWPCRERIVPDDNGPLTMGFRAQLIHRWRTDRRLRRFVAVRWIYDAGSAVAIFFSIYALRRFDLTGSQADAAAGSFTIVLFAAHMIGGVVFGFIGDRRGFRRVIAWGMLSCCVASVWAMLAPTKPLYYLVFLFQGISVAGVMMGSMNLIIEMTPEGENRSSALALLNTLVMPAWLVAPLAAGAIAEWVSVPHALLLGLLLQGAGWIALVALVDDPRRPGRRILIWPHPRWRTFPRYLW